MHRMLLLSDIHVGSVRDTIYFFNVIADIFEQELIFNHTDAVIILGDFFDKLSKANDQYTILAINIMSHLIRLSKRANTKIRIIYGTESHEMSQYALFSYHFEEESVDMKIIDTVWTEELFPDINVLYIPEEYIENKHEYYKKHLYSGEYYTYIFGHGIIAEGMPMVNVKIEESKSSEKKVPVFRVDELSSICELCIYGHYHLKRQISDNCYYLGSLFRDKFGEEDPKVYGVIEDGVLTFVENKDAYTYKSYEYESSSEIYNSLDNLINEVKKIKSENFDIFSGKKVGKIKIIFHLPDDTDTSFKEGIRNILFKDKEISYIMKEASVTKTEVDNKVETEYDFILDSVDVEYKIHRFINKVHEHEIMTFDEVNEIIHGKLKI